MRRAARSAASTVPVVMVKSVKTSRAQPPKNTHIGIAWARHSASSTAVSIAQRALASGPDTFSKPRPERPPAARVEAHERRRNLGNGGACRGLGLPVTAVNGAASPNPECHCRVLL